MIRHIDAQEIRVSIEFCKLTHADPSVDSALSVLKCPYADVWLKAVGGFPNKCSIAMSRVYDLNRLNQKI